MGVDIKYCQDAGLPTLISSQACEMNLESVCWGPTANSTGVKNGRCDAESGGCVCRSGTVGTFCDQAGRLDSVETNGDEFADGIPIGELLLIKWNSTVDSLPLVNILLSKNLSGLPASMPPQGADWSTSMYLGANIKNSGFFQWKVGSLLSGSLEAGTGYRVVVWYSQNLRAESAPFAISDPCAYKSCGVHGVCNMGVCACSEGFSGDACTLGPCERADCAPDTATCNNTDLITTPPSTTPKPACMCTGGFTGTQVRRSQHSTQFKARLFSMRRKSLALTECTRLSSVVLLLLSAALLLPAR